MDLHILSNKVFDVKKKWQRRGEDKGREVKGKEGKGREGKGREGKGSEAKRSEAKRSERKGREGKGREGKGKERKGREGKGIFLHFQNLYIMTIFIVICWLSSILRFFRHTILYRSHIARKFQRNLIVLLGRIKGN